MKSIYSFGFAYFATLYGQDELKDVPQVMITIRYHTRGSQKPDRSTADGHIDIPLNGVILVLQQGIKSGGNQPFEPMLAQALKPLPLDAQATM